MCVLKVRNPGSCAEGFNCTKHSITLDVLVVNNVYHARLSCDDKLIAPNDLCLNNDSDFQ